MAQRLIVLTEKKYATIPKTRISIGLFLLPWVILKFSNPQYSSDIVSYFYKVNIPAEMSFLLGVLWTVLLLTFVRGFKKKISYGLVFIAHTISTLTTWKILVNPINTGDNKDILFMAALPVLAAVLLLYVLREHGTLFSIG